MSTQAFTAVAQLGTAKQTLPSTDAPWASYHEAMHEASAEGKFYQLSALQLAYQRAGKALLPRSAEVMPLRFEAVAEERVLPSVAAEQLLAWLHAQTPSAGLAILLAPLLKHGYVLDEACLLAFFELRERGRPSPYIHQILHQPALLGARGRFMVQVLGLQTVAPQSALAELDFSLADFEQRLQWLRMMRQQAPETARVALEQTWKHDKAAHRLRFLQVLAETLHADDIPFLESALQDRSEEVRKTARQLLIRLPSTQRAQIATWFQERAQWQGKQWQLLARDYVPEMAAYGIEELSKQRGESDEHHVLRQLLVQLDDDFWAKTFQLPVAEALSKLVTHCPVSIERSVWTRWAQGHVARTQALLQHGKRDHIDLLSSLSCAEKEQSLQMLAEKQGFARRLQLLAQEKIGYDATHHELVARARAIELHKHETEWGEWYSLLALHAPYFDFDPRTRYVLAPTAAVKACVQQRREQEPQLAVFWQEVLQLLEQKSAFQQALGVATSPEVSKQE